GLADIIADQAGNHHGAARRELDRGVGEPLADRKDIRRAALTAGAQLNRAFVRRLRHLGAYLQADAAGRQHGRLEFEADAVLDLLVVVGDRAVVGINRLAGDQVELAADPERRLLAGDRRQRRFGERLHHARLLHRIEIGAERRALVAEAGVRYRLAQPGDGLA